MAKKVKAKGVVSESGEFKIYNSEYFKGKVINDFRGKKIKILVEQDLSIVSTPQLRYYFGVMIKLIKNHFLENGDKYSTNEIDGFLRDNFLFEETVDFVTGEVVTKAMKLNTEESTVSTVRMMQFWDDVALWANEKLTLYIPPPTNKLKTEMLEQSPENHH